MHFWMERMLFNQLFSIFSCFNSIKKNPRNRAAFPLIIKKTVLLAHIFNVDNVASLKHSHVCVSGTSI